MATEGSYRLELEPQKENVFVTQLRYVRSNSLCSWFNSYWKLVHYLVVRRYEIILLLFCLMCAFLSTEKRKKMTTRFVNFPSLKRYVKYWSLSDHVRFVRNHARAHKCYHFMILLSFNCHPAYSFVQAYCGIKTNYHIDIFPIWDEKEPCLPVSLKSINLQRPRHQLIYISVVIK